LSRSAFILKIEIIEFAEVLFENKFSIANQEQKTENRE